MLSAPLVTTRTSALMPNAMALVPPTIDSRAGYVRLAGSAIGEISRSLPWYVAPGFDHSRISMIFAVLTAGNRFSGTLTAISFSSWRARRATGWPAATTRPTSISMLAMTPACGATNVP